MKLLRKVRQALSDDQPIFKDKEIVYTEEVQRRIDRDIELRAARVVLQELLQREPSFREIWDAVPPFQDEA